MMMLISLLLNYVDLTLLLKTTQFSCHEHFKSTNLMLKLFFCVRLSQDKSTTPSNPKGNYLAELVSTNRPGHISSH